MRVLIVGTGKGSWTVRGIQLGAALGARVTSSPSASDVKWADVVILVKRAIVEWGPQMDGKPVVWDALDFWGQPGQNSISEASARMLVEQHVSRVKPGLVIGATQAMATAIGGVYLPHHAWTGLVPTPARERVKTVVYEGNEGALGRWTHWVRNACQERGWTFLINPPDIRVADILIALRDGQWDGWICREWKSGIKLVNAIAAGRPVIGQESAAWRELQPHGLCVESQDDLHRALDWWAPFERRGLVVEASDPTPFAVSAVAEQYQTLLERVACPV